MHELGQPLCNNIRQNYNHVVDFYVQSKVDFAFRSYSGGFLGRHVNWFLRTFWRAWFDIDRVGPEGSR
ncbi:hypothetical protein N7471_011743 [Penicillium samsonianum]|uniref:uncharacterized protein n=1 Tax=Penicillium samsonianum TaxID=1882272 RepID=UPI0025487DE7|nr:uncharacterized protein N7471_011743 [Penicillium samsonianum]KAJ6124426.1 hypothetical protein N7471_011743 [Penicillium samsonianum]